MSDDLISRQAAIEACLNGWNYDMETIKHIQDNISRLPSVQQKTAYWIDVSGDVPIYNAGGFTEKRKIGVKCSNCQRLNTWCEFDYCPHCGAKMEGKRNETKRP